MKGNRTVSGLRAFNEWVKTLALAFLMFLVVRAFVVQSFEVISGSMTETVLVGDFLLINKLAYGSATPDHLPFTELELPQLRLPGYADPKLGDIVVFKYPLYPSLPYVKRCMGTPGDTLEMRDKVLLVNSVPLDEPYVIHRDRMVRTQDLRGYPCRQFIWQKEYLTSEARQRFGKNYRPTRDNFGPLVVPEGMYFCMGDNRDNSSDSRYWGFVPRGNFLGTPWVMYFSWDRRRLLPRFGRIGKLLE